VPAAVEVDCGEEEGSGLVAKSRVWMGTSTGTEEEVDGCWVLDTAAVDEASSPLL